MALYVSDLFTATAAPVNATPTSTRTWQWLRGSSAISGATSSTYTAVTADIGSTLSATQLETNFLATTTATSAATEVVQAFDPIRLFSASEPGVWYDPSDLSTLYQNASGTIPVTSFGQPVGLMLDKSRGLVLGPELITNGTFDTDVTGWTAGGGASLSSVGGKLRVTSNGSLAYAQLSFTTEVGKSYTLVMEAYKATSANYLVNLGSTVGGNNYVNKNSPDGQFSITFLATTTTATFRLYPETASGKYAEFDNISVKELPGLHATQSTDASRPLYGIVPVSGRRNLILWSQDFDNTSVWSNAGVGPSISSVTPNAATAPDGTMTADALNFSVVYQALGNSATITNGVQNTFSVYLRVDTGTRSISLNTNTSNILATFTVTSTWQRFTYTGTNIPSGLWALQDRNFSGYVTVYAWGAQLETGSTATAYQRVSTDLDVTEAGVASVGYLRFDGSTSWMVTPTITPGTDKVQVFAGVRKLSDAGRGILVELGSSSSGGMLIDAPATAAANASFSSRGTTAAQAIAIGLTAPITNVLTGIGDIAADTAVIRVNGTQAAQDTTDQGTGNYLAYPIYMGRRFSTGLSSFNGHLFPLIVRFGPNLTAARIAATEAWVATKTGGVTL